MGNLMFTQPEPEEQELSMESEDAVSNVLAAPPEVQDYIEAEFLNHLAGKVFEQGFYQTVGDTGDLAEELIRLLDRAAAQGIDIGGEFVQRMKSKREGDHIDR